MPELVRDPRYPDLIGTTDGPMTPCKIVEISATMAATDVVRRVSGYNAVHEQVEQRQIRYKLPPPPDAPDHRARILQLLAEDNQTEHDYDQIEQAKAIVREVNQRLKAQGSCTRYSVTHASGPRELTWGDDDA